MQARGYNHKSVLPFELGVDINWSQYSPYKWTEEEYRRDHEELMRRQNKEVKS